MIKAHHKSIIFFSTSLILVLWFSSPNQARAEQTFTIQVGEESWEIDREAIASSQSKNTNNPTYEFNSPLTDYFLEQAGIKQTQTKQVSSQPKINQEALGNFLLQIAKEFNSQPQDAKFNIEGERVIDFAPDLPGRRLDLARAQELIINKLNDEENATKVGLPVHTTPAKTKLSELNNLGINELISRGVSDFTGSSGSRITNIEVGAAKYRGLIVPQGAEFSFNENLGPVDAAHGFKPELVIKAEGIVPEFGGGLCQVSTTAFRAAFFAGAEITERRNHSIAVNYYKWIGDDLPPAEGFDATIYPGVVDLKFKNDTPAAILIWTHVDGNRLYFDFYGTKDGRQVTFDGPHPYDRQASGAVKSTVTRTVIKGGETLEDTFQSNYRAPYLYPRVYTYPDNQSQSENAETSSEQNT